MVFTNEAFHKIMELLEVEKSERETYFLNGIEISYSKGRVRFDSSSFSDEQLKERFYLKVFLPTITKYYDRREEIRGLISIILCFQERYSKQLVHDISVKVYDYLIRMGDFISESPKCYCRKEDDSKKLSEFFDLLEEFNNLVNPFGNKDLELKESVDTYLDKLNLRIGKEACYNRMNMDNVPKVFINVNCNNTRVRHQAEEVMLTYSSCASLFENRKRKHLSVDHSYWYNYLGEAFEDFRICVRTETGRLEYDMVVDLNKGKAEDFSVKTIPLSDISEENLTVFIHYLKAINKKIRKKIIKYMVVSE